MRATPQSRFFNTRVSATGDEEAQQQQNTSVRRRVTGRQSSFYDRNRRLNGRRRTKRRARSGIQSLFLRTRGRATVFLAIATWTCAFVIFRIYRWASLTPVPLITPILGPDAIPSAFRVERRKWHGRPREPSGSRMTGATEGSVRTACLNTAQGVALLADSEGRVCYRNNTDQDPLRAGCCSTNGPLPHLPTPRGDRALSALASAATTADNRNESLRNLQRTVTRNNRATDSEEQAAAAQRRKEDGVDIVSAPEARSLSSGESPGDNLPPLEALSTVFSCWSCDVSDVNGGSSCCRLYEFCVSCCLDPGRAHEREEIYRAAARSGHPAYTYDAYADNDGQVGVFCACTK